VISFLYDFEGDLTEDKYLQGESCKNAFVHFYCRTVVYCTLRNSKGLKISYDWGGMPIEFVQEPTGSSSDTLFRLLMKYDGTGRRISKTVMHKVAGTADWDTAQVTHYTGIGTEIRENFAGPAKETKVVVNMPQGLGRYGIEDAENPDMGSGAGYIPNTKFEWYLKNHLGSTKLVYGTQADANPSHSDIGTLLAAYDYRSFGEMVELTPPSTGKVTENFTGSRFARRTQRTACKSIAEPKNLGAKRNEHDDEIALNYFGARYLDPMLGMWISVDPLRFFTSPYLYMGNGYNPIRFADLTGMKPGDPFGSRKEAAEDFARTYNDDSIREGVEYSTAIYSYMKDGEKLYLYNIPLKGTPDRTPFDTYLPSGCKMESSAHTHGEFLDSYKLGNFVPSSGDKEGDYFATYIIGKISGPAYLSNPAGHLIEYGLDAIGNTYYKILPTTGIAADDKSPIIMPGAPSAFDGSDDDVYR